MTVYLETTIPSYLAALPSRDIVVAAHQEITRQWWWERREAFDVFVSELVALEAERGEPAVAAQRRLQFLKGIPRLGMTDEAHGLAGRLVDGGAIPFVARADALHIAVATAHGLDFLLTWNCRHIANAECRSRIVRICRQGGFEPPILCTPEELLGVEP
jgi:hypothetical protein